ncbi:hypothetical protein DFR49_3628 [Hephaestia caeni]|uniref:Uncharacterized protein n=1 Tax=Hephaestia caeni TaxID=645617 RepID=A0A397NJP2_9SPHN|nr:hypothetical protein [Hephaestia caeni]RIA37740.1 hypothetical protein DFR49_3628 [Hephaestia caeni]
MNAITETTAAPQLPAPRAQRHDGWTPDRQRAFLENVAEGYSAEQACRIVGMAPSSAYALRRRAAGAAFAIGWRAANLLARDKVADTLLARAIDGQVDTYTRADGTEVTRHRYDNRLASTMLARLDRFADAAAGEATHHAARLVAAEFDSFLDLIDRDQGPARTGMFLATRIAGEEADPDLGAVVALARADRWLRTGRGTAAEVDTSDLDPDARAAWTAEQWTRAEAAGLIAFAAPADAAPHAPLSPLHPEAMREPEPDSPVWWCPYADDWRTRFAPPAGFDGDQAGRFGDEGYSRTLTLDEHHLVETAAAIEHVELCAEHAPERTAWFAALAAQTGPDAPDASAPDVADAPEAPAPDSADHAAADQPATAPQQDQPDSINPADNLRTDRDSGHVEPKMVVSRDPKRSARAVHQHRKRGKPPVAGQSEGRPTFSSRRVEHGGFS